MPRTIKPKEIRAPAKILVGLRFKNRCILCGEEISQGTDLCPKCKKKSDRDLIFQN